MNNEILQQLGRGIDDSFFLIGAAMLAIELARGLLGGGLKWRGVGDMLASASTQVPFLLFEIFVLSFAYAIYDLIYHNHIGWGLGISTVTVVLALLVADFIYYWEHRFAHLVRILWVQHAVHHSSRYMNIVTGFRFGPFEGVWSFIAFLPMVLLGFPPELVIFGNLAVLAYQTWIHTELIGKLGPLEWVLNTPSHHRVHHGCDEKYLDKNYGGILIIWDRLFGSFQVEEETPRYGLARDFDSTNPVKVWFSEWPALFRDMVKSKSGGELWGYLFRAPHWTPSKGEQAGDNSLAR